MYSSSSFSLLCSSIFLRPVPIFLTLFITSLHFPPLHHREYPDPMVRITHRTRPLSSCIRCTQAYRFSTTLPIYTFLGLKYVASLVTLTSKILELQPLSSSQKDVIFITSSPSYQPIHQEMLGSVVYVTSCHSVLFLPKSVFSPRSYTSYDTSSYGLHPILNCLSQNSFPYALLCFQFFIFSYHAPALDLFWSSLYR